MASRVQVRRIASGVLIVLGIALLLGGCAVFARQQLAGAQLRAELQQTPAPTSAPPASPTPAPTQAVAVEPTTTNAPTAAPPATAAPTEAAQPQPSPTAEPTSAASTAAPTLAPTAVKVAPTPTLAPAVPVRLVIPDLKIDTSVVEMSWEVVNTASGLQSEWVIPKNAAGHHINSAALGQTGNIVISGHNNIEGKVFEAISLAWDDKTRTRVDDATDRSDILNGRQIQLYDAAGRVFNYTITDFLRLQDSGVSLAQRVDNAHYIDQTDNARLTLITCWPPWSNTHRLVVIAQPSQP